MDHLVRGGIYKISIDGNDEADKHPRVVILGNQDSDQCLVIPCYSAGGEWAEAWIKELMGGGRTRDAIVVEMDNTKHCHFHTGFPAKEQVYWMVFDPSHYSTQTILSGKKIGEMNDAGQLLIVDGLLKLFAEAPQFFSKKTIKKIKKLREELLTLLRY